MPDNIKLKCRQLTLITGLPRSGTTWTGKMIGSHPDTNYIFEPFSKRYHPQLKHSEICFNLGANYLRQDITPNKNWIFNENVFDELESYEDILREHINDLITYYFQGEEDKHLIIKSPKTSKIQWFIKVLQPQHVIYIDRHLGAVVNSYIKVKLGISGWAEQEFKLAKNSIKHTNPTLAHYFDIPKNRIERATAVLALNRKIALNFLDEMPSSQEVYCRVEYENLCLNTKNELSKIFSFIGLPFDDSIWEKISLAVSKNKAKAIHLEINKDSQKKMYEWVNQFSPIDFVDFKTINRKFELNLPLPSKELPAQPLKYKFTSTINVIPRYFKRLGEEFNNFRGKTGLTKSNISKKFKLT